MTLPNDPALWARYVPRRAADSHKYSNGPVLVASGPALRTGSAADFAALLASGRYRAVVLGPAAGLGEATAPRIETIVAARIPAVLDADTLTVLARERERVRLSDAGANLVLTPHEGEFRRLFPNLARQDPIFATLPAAEQGSKLERARRNQHIWRAGTRDRRQRRRSRRPDRGASGAGHADILGRSKRRVAARSSVRL